MQYFIIIIISILAFDHFSTASETSNAAGYKDGYAIGHHQYCQPRTVLIAGDWDNEDYSAGYHRGVQAGYTACTKGNK